MNATVVPDVFIHKQVITWDSPFGTEPTCNLEFLIQYYFGTGVIVVSSTKQTSYRMNQLSANTIIHFDIRTRYQHYGLQESEPLFFRHSTSYSSKYTLTNLTSIKCDNNSWVVFFSAVTSPAYLPRRFVYCSFVYFILLSETSVFIYSDICDGWSTGVQDELLPLW